MKTKQGGKGKTAVNYTFNAEFSQPTKLLKKTRGYDYAYTFDPMNYSRPWGTVPDLVNVDGVWAIPENWSSLPEGTQPTLQDCN